MVLQRYLTRLILAYARAYIGNIEANLHLSLWGGDVVLDNLELRLDVLQRAIGLPADAHFAFERGRIKQMRIHIPWTALTYKPVEVTLTDVDCVLTAHARPHEGTAQPAAAAAAGAAAAAAASSVSASAALPASPSPSDGSAPVLEAEEAAEVGGSGWAADLIAKIVANLTVRIQGLSFSFIQDGPASAASASSSSGSSGLAAHSVPAHSAGPRTLPAAGSVSSAGVAIPPRRILMSLRIAHALLQSTNSKHAVQFVELEGPWKLIHKSLDIQHVSLHLGHMDAPQQQQSTQQTPAGGAPARSPHMAAPAVAAVSGASPHRGCAQLLSDDDAILRDMSLTLRIRTYLAALGGSSLIRLPYRDEKPPPLSGPAMAVEVHMQQAAQFYVSDRQLHLLTNVMGTLADRTARATNSSRASASPSSRASRSSPSPTADSLSLAHLRSSSPAAAGATGILHPSLAQQHNTAATAASLALPSSTSPARAGGGGGSGSRIRSSSLPSASGQQSRGWRSWMWALVGEEDGRSSRSNPAAEFYLAFGHLAPKEQLDVSAHIPAIELHLLHTVSRPERRALFEQHHQRHRERAARWAAKDPTRRPVHGSLVTFASVRVHEIDVSASQQLLLPSPTGLVGGADEEEQRQTASGSGSKRALNLRISVSVPKTTVEISDIERDSLLRLQLDTIIFSHERSSHALPVPHAHSRPTSPSSPSGRSASTADASHAEAVAALAHATVVVEGSLRIQTTQLTHVHMEREHALCHWRATPAGSSPSPRSSTASPAAPTASPLPVICQWNAQEVDVEICGFDLYVPLVSAHLVLQALTLMQPPVGADAHGAPNPPAARALTPRPIRPYRANAQRLKLVLHGGRIGVGTSLDGRGSTLGASLQWQSAFVLQSPTQCDPMWQHVLLSDALQVRVVDLACCVGKRDPHESPMHAEHSSSSNSSNGGIAPAQQPSSPAAPDPLVGFFPSSPCLSPVTCVVEHVERTKVETIDPSIGAQFQSMSALLAATSQPSFTPLYRAAHVDVQAQELRAHLELEQVAILVALAQEWAQMNPRTASPRGRMRSPAPSPLVPTVALYPSSLFLPSPTPVYPPSSTDDFRSLKQLPTSDPSQQPLPHPRAGHLALWDQHEAGQQLCLSWRYPSPRAIVQLNFRPVRPAASPALPQYVFGALSAWEPVSRSFVHVCDVLVDLYGLQRAPLSSPHVVAEEWRFTVATPTDAQVRQWSTSSRTGKYHRWAQLLSRQRQSSAPRPLPSARELAQCMRVESRLHYQHGRNMHVRVSIPHAQLTLSDRAYPATPPTELGVLHVQRVHMRSQMLLRHPLDPSGFSTRVGSASAFHVSADGVWVDLVQPRDLTLHPLLRPTHMSALLRHNDLADGAQLLPPGASPSVAHDGSFLPASLCDHRERGWAVSIQSGAARINVGSKVLLTAKLVAQRMKVLQQRMETIANDAEPIVPVPSSTTSTPSAAGVHASAAYVLTNRSGIALRYGQVGTRESVSLPVDGVHSYSWSCLSPALAHPLHAPPEVANAFEAPAEPWRGPHESDERLRYHWLRVSTAEVHAWSRAFMIDVPASNELQVDFSSLQQIGKMTAAAARGTGGPAAAAATAPLHHVFLYRMAEEQVSSRHDLLPGPANGGVGGGRVGPAMAASPPSVHACILFVSVERRGLNTFVTFLPSHSLLNQLPLALAAHSDTESEGADAHAHAHDAWAAMQRGSTGATLSGFGVEGRHIDLPPQTLTPLPLWYPCSVAQSNTKPQRVFKFFVRPRVDADSASFLHPLVTYGSLPPSPAHPTSSGPVAIASSGSVEAWEWSELLSLPLDSLSSFLAPGLVSPPPPSPAPRSRHDQRGLRLCTVRHKLDPARRIHFWAQTAPFPSEPSAMSSLSSLDGRYALPSVLHPWRITLSPAFILHNPLSCSLLLHLTPTSGPRRPSHPLPHPHAAPVVRREVEVAQRGVRLDSGQTRAVLDVDPTAADTVQLSIVVPAQDQQQSSTGECRPLASSLLTLSAHALLPASGASLPTSGGQSVQSVSLQGAGCATDPMHDCPQLHLVMSSGAGEETDTAGAPQPRIPASPVQPTLRVSLVAPFQVHNLCTDAMWVRTADSSAPILVQGQTASRREVDYLQWSVDDIATLSVGVHADPTEPASLVYWSKPFSTAIPVAARHADASAGTGPAARPRNRRAPLQSDIEVDILAVANVEPPGSRPIVMLHQFVVSVSKERASASKSGEGKADRGSGCAGEDACGMSGCPRCCDDTVWVTHLWIKPRFFVHNRTGLPLHLRQLGVLSASPIPGPPLMGAGEARALEAWNVSCAARSYEPSLAREFAPLVSLSLPSSSLSVSDLPPGLSGHDGDALGGFEDDEEEWSWSGDLRLLDAPARASVTIYNCRLGYQRLLSYAVLHYRRVRHIVVYHDSQAQCVLLNRMHWPIEWRERSAAFLQTPTAAPGAVAAIASPALDVEEGRVCMLAPEQCTEFQLAAARVANPARQLRATQEQQQSVEQDDTASVASEESIDPDLLADDSDESSLESQLALLGAQHDSGWEGEDRAFSPGVALSQLVFRMAGSVHEAYPWSTALPLRPGEYTLLLPAASPALPPLPARIAVQMRNGSVLIVVEALDEAREMAAAPTPAAAAAAAASRALRVDVAVAELSVAIHDDAYVGASCSPPEPLTSQIRGNNESVAAERHRKDSFSSSSSPRSSAPAKAARPIGTAALDGMGELLLLLTLERVHMRSQLTTQQPLDHYAPFMADPNAPSTTPIAAPRRLTLLSPSVLPQLYTVLDCEIGAVQLDNHLEAELPVVLCSFRPDPHAAPMPALQLSFVSSVPSRLHESGPGLPAPLLSSSSVLRRSDVHIVSARLSPFCVNLEDQLAFRIIALGMAWARDARGDFATMEPRVFAQMATSMRAPSSASSARHLLAQSMHLSEECLAQLDKVSQARLFLHYLHVSDLDLRVTVRAGAGVPVFLGAEQMPVSLSSVSLRYVLCPVERLVRELVAGYTASAIARSPMLLGSLDLLGNPTFWLQSVGAGVRDLLLLPRNALGQGPRAFVGAVGGGLLSLLRHTTEGTLTSVSGFSSSLSRNMERLSGSDTSALARRPGRRPASVGGGLVSGVKSLGQGVVGGLVGVVAQPLAGASSGGVGGFFRGVGSGLVGAVSKPIGGVCDLVTATSQGLARTSGVDSMPHTHRFVRRGEGSGAHTTDGAAALAGAPTTLHCFHRLSTPKIERIAAQLGETPIDHAVVAFAHHVSAPAVSRSSSSSRTSPAAKTAAVPLDAGDFALLLVTNVGVRLVRDDRVADSFRWDEVEVSHVRSAVVPSVSSASLSIAPSSAGLVAAFLDERGRLEWMCSGLAATSSAYGQGGHQDDDPDADELGDVGGADLNSLALDQLPSLSFDVLVVSPRDGVPLRLWLPRMRRAPLLAACLQAQKEFNQQALMHKLRTAARA